MEDKKESYIDPKINNVLNSFRDGFNDEKLGISFDPDLISNLQADHELLGEAITEIEEAIPACNYEKIEYIMIKRLKPVLVKHLINESVKLYTFLGHAVPKDTEDHKFLITVRQRMYQIGHTVFRFTTKYKDAQVIKNEWDDFVTNFQKIKTILISRISVEEERIYSMYQSLAPKA